VRAAAVAGVDVAGGGHVEGAGEVVAGALAVELAGAEVDVRGAVAVDPRLGLKAVGAGVAGVEGDRLEDGEHCTQSTQSTHAKRSVSLIVPQFTHFSAAPATIAARPPPSCPVCPQSRSPPAPAARARVALAPAAPKQIPSCHDTHCFGVEPSNRASD
jgi:hypothetical protein